MCDCYWQQCEKCEAMIPVHIGDFNYPRKDVKVFCKNHIPNEKVTIFENITDMEGYDFVYDHDRKTGELITEKERVERCGLDEEEKKGWKCAIRLKDGEIEPSSEDVHPNTSPRQKITILKCVG